MENFELQKMREQFAAIAKALHYPVCWDLSAYPTLISAIQEIFRCSVCFDGPDAEDGHDSEGFPGGCARFGCPGGSNCTQYEKTRAAFEEDFMLSNPETWGRADPEDVFRRYSTGVAAGDYVIASVNGDWYSWLACFKWAVKNRGAL